MKTLHRIIIGDSRWIKEVSKMLRVESQDPAKGGGISEVIKVRVFRQRRDTSKDFKCIDSSRANLCVRPLGHLG